MRKRIAEVEESNEISTIALSRTRTAIRRLRLEYAILLERLESRLVPNPNGPPALEHVSRPPTPSILDDMSLKASRNGSSKPATQKVPSNSNGSTKKVTKDPDLPKRPTNAYLIFCEMEKDKVKSDLEAKNPGQSATELSKTLTELWKTLDEEQRKPYNRLYEEDRERYQREMITYNTKKIQGGEPSKKIDADSSGANEDGDVEEDMNADVTHDESFRNKKQRIDTGEVIATEEVTAVPDYTTDLSTSQLGVITNTDIKP